MEKRYETLDRIIEYGIYLYIFLTFLAKGEGIRNILIFGNFALWLFTLKHRKNLYLLKKPVSKWLWIWLGVAPFAVIFSIDPLYSLMDLKRELLKVGLLFPVISTVMADGERLKKALFVCYVTAILIVGAGFYSYGTQEMEMLKPDTLLVHIWHNRFARYLCMLLPFSFVLYHTWKGAASRTILTVSLVVFVLALVLSTSRGGLAGFASIMFIWSLYLSRKKGYNLKKIMAYLIIVPLVIGILAYWSVPDVKTRIDNLTRDLHTFNERTVLWKAAVYAIVNRPVTGWGYGDDLFHRDEPFKETILKKALPTDKNQHNMFLEILFHQGIIGFIPYLLLVLIAIKVFWTEALRATGLKSYMLIACASIILGNYVVHSMLTSVEMTHLAVVLGLGMAASGTNESSHN
ncbi:MAG: hypothetical protein C4560_00210 [Nitrospiraceae bacterium]|nr:MAG: hypothetical protein C4560_00210 [Nitrospiraceae bacterium]